MRTLGDGFQVCGFDPDKIIGDGAKGLRDGQKAAISDTLCHGNIFLILKQLKEFVQSLTRKAQGATTSRLEQKEDIVRAQLAQEPTWSMTSKWVHLKRREQ